MERTVFMTGTVFMAHHRSLLISFKVMPMSCGSTDCWRGSAVGWRSGKPPARCPLTAIYHLGIVAAAYERTCELRS